MGSMRGQVGVVSRGHLNSQCPQGSHRPNEACFQLGGERHEGRAFAPRLLSLPLCPLVWRKHFSHLC